MKLTCPLGHKCEVRDDSGNVEERCRWFTQLRGSDPQSGQEKDEWSCAIAFLPILQIETSQQTRQAGAAVESLRNELVVTSKPADLRLINQETDDIAGPELTEQRSTLLGNKRS